MNSNNVKYVISTRRGYIADAGRPSYTGGTDGAQKFATPQAAIAVAERINERYILIECNPLRK